MKKTLQRIFLTVAILINVLYFTSCFNYKGFQNFVEDRTKANNEYSNFREEWNDYHNPKPDAGKIIKDVMTAAENGDKETLRQFFCEKRQSFDDFEDQLDEFMKNIPVGLADLDYEEDRLDNAWGRTDGKLELPITRHYKQINLDGKYYYVFLDGYAKNEVVPSMEGLWYFYIFDEASCAKFDYYDLKRGQESDRYDQADYEFSSFALRAECSSSDIVSRSIDGYAWIFEDIDRTITEDQFMREVEKAENINELRAALGQENGDLNNEYCYEISSAEDKKIYGIFDCDIAGRKHWYYLTDAEGSDRLFGDEYNSSRS